MQFCFQVLGDKEVTQGRMGAQALRSGGIAGAMPDNPGSRGEHSNSIIKYICPYSIDLARKAREI